MADRMGENPFPNFRPENLAAAISTLQPGSSPVVSEPYYEGKQCRVYRVDFENTGSWAVRIPVNVQATSREQLITFFRGEYDVLQEIARAGLPWTPKLQGSDLTFDNLIGLPFMAMSWIDGEPLTWTAEYPSKLIRLKLLAQIADIQIALIEATMEDSKLYLPDWIQLLTFYKEGPATEFFSRIVENKLARVRRGELPEITEQDCYAQRDLFVSVLYPELENTPFAMDHGDLSPSNILVDRAYNVTG